MIFVRKNTTEFDSLDEFCCRYVKYVQISKKRLAELEEQKFDIKGAAERSVSKGGTLAGGANFGLHVNESKTYDEATFGKEEVIVGPKYPSNGKIYYI